MGGHPESLARDDPKYFAASTLLQLDDNAATPESTTPFRTAIRDDASDHRPDLVRDLVDTGTENDRSLFAERVAEGHANEWCLAWMTIGLYELGDRS